MEDQLFEAKKALKSRANASGRLEDRLAKIDSELNRYRERYGKLERQNSSNKRPSEQSRNSRSRSLSPRKSEGCEGELVCIHICILAVNSTTTATITVVDGAMI